MSIIRNIQIGEDPATKPNEICDRANKEDEVPLGDGQTFSTTYKTVHGPAWIFDIMFGYGGAPQDATYYYALVRDSGEVVLQFSMNQRAQMRWVAAPGECINVPDGRFLDLKCSASHRWNDVGRSLNLEPPEAVRSTIIYSRGARPPGEFIPSPEIVDLFVREIRRQLDLT